MIITFVIIILDQFTKYLAIKWSTSFPIDIIPGIFSLSLVFNKGGAFGLFKGKQMMFIAISVVAIVTIIWLINKMRNGVSVLFPNRNMAKHDETAVKWALLLLLAGAISNLIDRLRFGYVIDFFDFKVWPVFNVADSAITIGITILLFVLLFRCKAKTENQ